MKTIGIIGGIAPESTIVYYKEIVQSFLALNKENNYPQIIINSINMKEMLDYLASNDLDGLTQFLLAEIDKLEKAGADFGLLASNTPHIVFDRLKKGSKTPLLSIVELACRKAEAMKLKRVGLFGTKFTMKNTFYKEVFSLKDIFIITPDDESQEFIHRIYFDELVKGVFKDDTKSSLLKIIAKMKAVDNIDGLVLGGTELPLILKANDGDIPFLDTTKIHVEGIIEFLMSN